MVGNKLLQGIVLSIQDPQVRSKQFVTRYDVIIHTHAVDIGIDMRRRRYTIYHDGRLRCNGTHRTHEGRQILHLTQYI